jgi:hypothetical protein
MIEADVCDSAFGVFQRRAQMKVHDFTPFCSMLPLRAPVGKSCGTGCVVLPRPVPYTKTLHS